MTTVRGGLLWSFRIFQQPGEERRDNHYYPSLETVIGGKGHSCDEGSAMLDNSSVILIHPSSKVVALCSGMATSRLFHILLPSLCLKSRLNHYCPIVFAPKMAFITHNALFFINFHVQLLLFRVVAQALKQDGPLWTDFRLYADLEMFRKNIF